MRGKKRKQGSRAVKETCTENKSSSRISWYNYKINLLQNFKTRICALINALPSRLHSISQERSLKIWLIHALFQACQAKKLFYFKMSYLQTMQYMLHIELTLINLHYLQTVKLKVNPSTINRKVKASLTNNSMSKLFPSLCHA